MFLAEPPPSSGDLHFRLFGFPVRVHPLFWLVTGVMGLNRDGGTPPAELVAWVAVVFVSILVHELGHAFAFRRFGGHPRITLHGIGGLASCKDCDPRPRSQIIIALAGPAAGFALAVATVAAIKLSGHGVGFAAPGGVLVGSIDTAREPVGLVIFSTALFWDAYATAGINDLLYQILRVNIFWGLINLLPVYPLDGGRVAREICTLGNPRRGIILSLQISLVTAIAMAAIGWFKWHAPFTAMMFGYLGYSSYQTLQAYRANRW